MRLYTWILLASSVPANAFVPSVVQRPTFTLLSSSSTDAETVTTKSEETKQKYLGLLTFDLDDSLYPLEKVINEANEAFVRAMNNYGYTGTVRFLLVCVPLMDTPRAHTTFPVTQTLLHGPLTIRDEGFEKKWQRRIQKVRLYSLIHRFA